MFANFSLMLSLPCFKDVNNAIIAASALSNTIDRIPQINMEDGKVLAKEINGNIEFREISF